jgi:hypothetical protein
MYQVYFSVIVILKFILTHNFLPGPVGYVCTLNNWTLYGVGPECDTPNVRCNPTEHELVKTRVMGKVGCRNRQKP